jgi:hypothetical protein
MMIRLLATVWRYMPFKRQLKGAYYSRANPVYWARLIRVCRTLAFRYGLLDTMIRREAVDSAGEAIPWYTYPATEFLTQLDFADKTIFEYGCGNSTLFWSRRARRVVSVEHEREWCDHVKRTLPDNCELIFANEPVDYISAVQKFDEMYDVIVVDGQSRLSCAREAIARLRAGGFVILDNSDWFPASSEILRAAGLIEIDFYGVAPINDYTSTTSVYLDRRFALKPRHDRQPLPGIGSIPKDFDEAWWKP